MKKQIIFLLTRPGRTSTTSTRVTARAFSAAVCLFSDPVLVEEACSKTSKDKACKVEIAYFHFNMNLELEHKSVV